NLLDSVECPSVIVAIQYLICSLLLENQLMDQILRLNEENGSLKQNLLTTNAALSASKTVPKGSGDISPNRYSKAATKIRSAGSPLTNGISHKHDGLSNGITSTNAKELSDPMEDKNRSLTLLRETHEAQMKQVMVELDKERSKSASMQMRFQEEQKLNGSLQQDLSSLKDDNNKILREMHQIRDQLNQKISEIGRLQLELQNRDIQETDDSVDKLQRVIANLEDENRNIKKEKDEFEASLKAIQSYPARKDIPGDVDPSIKHSSTMNESLCRHCQFEACQERDKALQQLNRLKQHLLQKESEESEKMDEDSKIIEELREINEHQRVQISRLEKTLKQAVGSQEEIKIKLSSYASTIDAKNMEIRNLQTALGQYYAEIEAKERLGEELAVSKEESARLTKQLKVLDLMARMLGFSDEDKQRIGIAQQGGGKGVDKIKSNKLLSPSFIVIGGNIR
ncbi:hypothetical protein MIMGU_mgv1a019598mg, partial [Erythranthe guttata]